MNIEISSRATKSTIAESKIVKQDACEEPTEDKSLSSTAEEQLKTLKIQNAILEENKIIRRILIGFLSLLSLGWLYFTGYEIRQIAKLHHYLPASVAIAFITTSLGTVVGLWAIGLKYFFHNKN